MRRARARTGTRATAARRAAATAARSWASCRAASASARRGRRTAAGGGSLHELFRPGAPDGGRARGRGGVHEQERRASDGVPQFARGGRTIPLAVGLVRKHQANEGASWREAGRIRLHHILSPAFPLAPTFLTEGGCGVYNTRTRTTMGLGVGGGWRAQQHSG